MGLSETDPIRPDSTFRAKFHLTYEIQKHADPE
mgnify:CR=1 FL=1